MMPLEIPKYPKEFIDSYVKLMICKYLDSIISKSLLKRIEFYKPNIRKTFGYNSATVIKCLIKEYYFHENHFDEITLYAKTHKTNLETFVKAKLGTSNKILINKITTNNFKDYRNESWYGNFVTNLNSLIIRKSQKIINFDESYKKVDTNDFVDYFRELILVKPEHMASYIQNRPKYQPPNFKNIKKIYNLSQEIEINKKLEKINSYMIRNFIFSDSCGLIVCPYCNRNYINSRGNSFSAEMDHFYNKNDFPIFAVSLYNFIPSCGTCNRLKRTYDLKINPFLKCENNCVKFDIIKYNENYKIELKYIKDNKLLHINTHPDLENDLINILKLDKAYKIHNLEVQEMVNREMEYGQEYRNSLIKLLTGTEEEINRKIDTLIYGEVVFAQESELINKSLGKFKKEAYEKIKGWKLSKKCDE